VVAEQLPGSRAMTTAGIDPANLPANLSRYGRVTLARVVAVVMSQGSNVSTGEVWVAWVNSLATGPAFTRDWVRNRTLARRVVASNMADVEFEVNFGPPAERVFSRQFEPRESTAPVPIFVWANYAAVAYTIRYVVTLLCRDATQQV